jgi:hypothetical protein
VSVIAYWLLASSPFVLVAWAWAFGRKATEAQAKAQVYRDFAATFDSMRGVPGIKDKERRSQESRRGYMQLALVDPWIRDGLRSALADADAHWKNGAEVERA